MNWNELKEFCNNLDETQLTKKVILWREEEAISDISAEQLEEDHYIDPNDGYGEGCFPESEAAGVIMDKDTYPNGMDDLEKVYDKGTPILYENF